MRELNKTGFMHNRVRMITASFLCKHLLVDWRFGETILLKSYLIMNYLQTMVIEKEKLEADVMPHHILESLIHILNKKNLIEIFHMLKNGYQNIIQRNI